LPPPSWNFYVDSLSTKDGSGVDLVIESPQGDRHEHTLKFMPKASNIEAEYEALIASVELCYIIRVDSVRAFSNSQLMVSQLNGEYEVKDNTIATYVWRVWEGTWLLKYLSIMHMPPSKNQQPSELS